MNSNAIIPICSLTTGMYSSSIKARVIWKSEITEWNAGTKRGIVYIMHLLDESGEITGIAFDDYDNRFYGQIQPGLVYLISGFEVEKAISSYKVSDNPYQLFFRHNTVLELSACGRIPREKYNFLPLLKVSSKADKDPVDAIGICTEVGRLEERGGYFIREILLVDPDNHPVMLNLWQKEAVNFVGQPNDVIVAKGARAQLHNNEMKLNASWYTNVQINPDIPDAINLLAWYNNQK
ncbi:replication protein A 70 kDa DNA-binding subunit-like [Drosophila mauritiana]|uniref:Replication protein A 70 kDa DNA-binding subunit-like n=1 Tax=Drosophila mauritiana TaxID=7226 RepID=A0A6P8K2R5_DROMA|nr:replication protein A 70 kDa DNA-binding subunit-like [Drosophila mauritiana]